MKQEWTRTFRTVLQVLIGILPMVPFLVGAVGMSTTVGVGAVIIAVAAVATRIMAIPEIDDWVNRFLRKKD